MKISPNKKFYISITGLIAGFLALVFLIVIPVFQMIEEDAKELRESKEAQETLCQEREKLKKFQETYIKISPDLEKIEQMFVDSDVPIDFIDFLERTAIDSNVFIEISSVNKKQEKEEGQLYAVFQMEVLGSFSDFMVFLEKVENATYLVEVDGLTINRMGEESEESVVEFSPNDISSKMSLKVFAK
jgi:hypothetical protein